MNDSNRSPLETIPPPGVIRQSIANAMREVSLLKSLLRLSKRMCQNSQSAAESTDGTTA
jgi:hypothetical protein